MTGRPAPSGSNAGDMLPRASITTHTQGGRNARDSHHRPRRPVHHQRRGIQRHRRRLRPRREHRGPLVRLDGRLPDGAQGDLGLAAEAAPRYGPPDTGRGRHGADRRLPAVHHPVRHDRHLDDQDRPSAGDRRLARARVHQDRRVRLREGLLPPAGAVGRGSPGAAPPVPRQAQPAAAPRLLGRMALGAGHRGGGGSTPPVGGRLSLQVLPQGQEAPRGPVLRRDVGTAHLPREALPREETVVAGGAAS